MTERLAPGTGAPPPGTVPGDQIARLGEALASFATGVTLVMVADGRDDIGTTVSAPWPGGSPWPDGPVRGSCWRARHTPAGKLPVP